MKKSLALKKKRMKKNKENNLLLQDINCVIGWLLNELDIDVVFETVKLGGNAYYHEAKLISINNQTNYYVQLHSILHEAGHAILRRKDEYEAFFPLSEDVSKSRDSRIDSLREEIYAWDEGFELANFLEIEIDEKKYLKHRNNNLYDYIKWTAK